jgi:hypothetical protein
VRNGLNSHHTLTVWTESPKKCKATLTPSQKWLLRLGMCSEKAPLGEKAIGVR